MSTISDNQVLISYYPMLAMINLFKSLNSEYNLIKTFASEYPYLTPINLFQTLLSESPHTHKRRCTTLSSTPVTNLTN